MTSFRKKPGVAFWATVMVVVVLLYLAALGPACWITSYAKCGGQIVSILYRPLWRACLLNERTEYAFIAYSEFAARDQWTWTNSLEENYSLDPVDWTWREL
jgi:hypothetical protein